MATGRREPIKDHVHMNCFYCKRKEADQVLHLEWDCLEFQLCLCPDCVELENDILVKELLRDRIRPLRSAAG